MLPLFTLYFSLNLNHIFKTTKVLSLNFLILLFLIVFPGFVYSFLIFVSTKINESQKVSIDPRANYPTYKDKEFSNQLFREYANVMFNVPITYYAFIGWRRNNSKLKHIEVQGRYNTRRSLGQKLNQSSWFFGGSSIWGTGASDTQSIPSIYHKLTDKKVYNFAEPAWNSRQSLNQLINVIADGYIPKEVIFFDGVNDISHGCRSENKRLANHAYENLIRNKLSSNSKQLISQEIKNFVLKPYIKISEKFIFTPKKTNLYDCDKDLNKAKRIAKHLLSNWYIAYLISTENQSQFLGILQPTIYDSNVSFDYFSRFGKEEVYLLKKQFESVYPHIISEMKQVCLKDPKFCKTLNDGRYWLKNKENIFIDFCHVNNIGNEIIAKQIIDIQD